VLEYLSSDQAATNCLTPFLAAIHQVNEARDKKRAQATSGSVLSLRSSSTLVGKRDTFEMSATPEVEVIKLSDEELRLVR
jgi:hypothetical protein